MKLIAEQTIGNITNIHESVDKLNNKKSLYIEGIFAQADLVNHNQRLYPKEVLKKAIGQYIVDYVAPKRAMGELNHPEEFAVNPERACILITSLKWDGNNVMGKAKVLETPQGKLIKTLLDDGVSLGVSTRGVGSLTTRYDGVTVVEEDYVISAIDVVSSPSAPEAFVNGILENANFVLKNNMITEETLDRVYHDVKVHDMFGIEHDSKWLADKLLNIGGRRF